MRTAVVAQVISPSRRSASMNPFTVSPGIPYTRRTPDASSPVTMTSATVLVMIFLWAAIGPVAAVSVSIAGVVTRRLRTRNGAWWRSRSRLLGSPLAAKLAQAARGPHLVRKEFRLFPGGKVTAPLEFVEVDEVGVGALGRTDHPTLELQGSSTEEGSGIAGGSPCTCASLSARSPVSLLGDPFGSRSNA